MAEESRSAVRFPRKDYSIFLWLTAKENVEENYIAEQEENEDEEEIDPVPQMDTSPTSSEDSSKDPSYSPPSGYKSAEGSVRETPWRAAKSTLIAPKSADLVALPGPLSTVLGEIDPVPKMDSSLPSSEDSSKDPSYSPPCGFKFAEGPIRETPWRAAKKTLEAAVSADSVTQVRPCTVSGSKSSSKHAIAISPPSTYESEPFEQSPRSLSYFSSSEEEDSYHRFVDEIDHVQKKNMSPTSSEDSSKDLSYSHSGGYKSAEGPVRETPWRAAKRITTASESADPVTPGFPPTLSVSKSSSERTGVLSSPSTDESECFQDSPRSVFISSSSPEEDSYHRFVREIDPVPKTDTLQLSSNDSSKDPSYSPMGGYKSAEVPVRETPLSTAKIFSIAAESADLVALPNRPFTISEVIDPVLKMDTSPPSSDDSSKDPSYSPPGGYKSAEGPVRENPRRAAKRDPIGRPSTSGEIDPVPKMDTSPTSSEDSSKDPNYSPPGGSAEGHVRERAAKRTPTASEPANPGSKSSSKQAVVLCSPPSTDQSESTQHCLRSVFLSSSSPEEDSYHRFMEVIDPVPKMDTSPPSSDDSSKDPSYSPPGGYKSAEGPVRENPRRTAKELQ